MKRRHRLLLLAGALVCLTRCAGGHGSEPPPERPTIICSACIGQVCGSDRECPGGCHCAKAWPSEPQGECR